MRPEIKRFDSSSPLEDMLEGLDRDGAAALLDVIDPDLVRQIDVDLAPYLDTARANPAGNGPSRIGAVIAKTLNVVPILQSRLLNRICKRFLLVDSSCYQLSAIHLIEVQPGSPQGTVHRDDAIWPMRGPRSIAVINFLLPITDFTMENGATRVILGSHRWPRDPAKIMPGRLELDVVEPVKQDDLVATPMPSGSIFPVLGGCLHCSGANTTGAPRRALSISVSLGWLRQEENQYLAVPYDRLCELPDDVQQLIGYRVHVPYLGHTGLD
jgi:hypothetical protein